MLFRITYFVGSDGIRRGDRKTMANNKLVRKGARERGRPRASISVWERRYKINVSIALDHHKSFTRPTVQSRGSVQINSFPRSKLAAHSAMANRISTGCKVVLLLCIFGGAYGGVVDNTVYTERTERISSSSELISSILNNCYDMSCLKGNVLSYLNSYLGFADSTARSADSVDEQIFDRVARALQTNDFKFQLPETFFRKSEISFNAERGFDVKVSEEAAVEGMCFVIVRVNFST